MTKIEWTHGEGYVGRTWNPTLGCDKVSAGCTNCYAIRQAFRMACMGRPEYSGLTYQRADGSMNWTGQVNLMHSRLNAPFGWKEPSMVFVDSMSDLFHEDVPDAFIAEVFGTMAYSPEHIYQVLTKRPERMRRFVSEWVDFRSVLKNVWFGVSTEDQEQADARIPYLLDTPAAVRFLSVEPQLGDVELYDFVGTRRPDNVGIHWVITGGESGPGARPYDPQWAVSLIRQCRLLGVPVFVKQMGAKPVGLKLHSRKGNDWSEWPEELRVREFPKVAVHA